jgi:hypothetical protein
MKPPTVLNYESRPPAKRQAAAGFVVLAVLSWVDVALSGLVCVTLRAALIGPNRSDHLLILVLLSVPLMFSTTILFMLKHEKGPWHRGKNYLVFVPVAIAVLAPVGTIAWF